MDYIKLCELGLLSLDGSERTNEIPPNSMSSLFLNDFVIIMRNISDSIQNVKSEVFILTYAAKELLSVVFYRYNKSFLEDVVEDMKQKNSAAVEYEIQKVLIVNARTE